MAIYSASTWHGSRAKGHSAAAHAAYISGETLRDERTGIRHDFSRRSGVEHAQTITPDREPCDLQELWNAAELAERNKDGRFKETARVFREWRIALPAELDADGRRAAAEEFATHLVDRYGVAATVAIHAPEKNQDRRNFHAHIQVTTREFSRTESGAVLLGDKAAIELKDSDRKKLGLASGRVEIKEIRKEWAAIANKHLAQAGVTARIDHRSYRDQRIDLTPGVHVGQAAWAMEQHGIRTERGDAWREAKEQQRREVISNPGIVAEKLAASQIIFDRADLVEEAERYISDEQQLERVVELAESGSIALPPSFMTTARGMDRAMGIAQATGYEKLSDLRENSRHGQRSDSQRPGQGVGDAAGIIVIDRIRTGRAISGGLVAADWAAGRAFSTLGQGNGLRELSGIDMAALTDKGREHNGDLILPDAAPAHVSSRRDHDQAVRQPATRSARAEIEETFSPLAERPPDLGGSARSAGGANEHHGDGDGDRGRAANNPAGVGHISGGVGEPAGRGGTSGGRGAGTAPGGGGIDPGDRERPAPGTGRDGRGDHQSGERGVRGHQPENIPAVEEPPGDVGNQLEGHATTPRLDAAGAGEDGGSSRKTSQPDKRIGHEIERGAEPARAGADIDNKQTDGLGSKPGDRPVATDAVPGVSGVHRGSGGGGWASRFRAASAAKRDGKETGALGRGVGQNDAKRARVDPEDNRSAREIDPAPYLESKGFDVRREGRHLSVREGGDEVYRCTKKEDGRWVWCDKYGQQGGDNIAMVRELEPGAGYADAVAALVGAPLHQPIARPQQPAPPREPPVVPFQRPSDEGSGREYLAGRGISYETLDAAREHGFLQYSEGAVLFVGYDDHGQAQNICRRAISESDPVQKRDFKGSDKSFPAVLEGDPKNVWVVEGGVDALAVQDMYRMTDRPPPTVIVSGGANTISWVERCRDILQQADQVVLAHEREKDAETQAHTDAGHAKQIRRIEDITEQPVDEWRPPVGTKDFADYHLREVREMERLQDERERVLEEQRQREKDRGKGWSR